MLRLRSSAVAGPACIAAPRFTQPADLRSVTTMFFQSADLASARAGRIAPVEADRCDDMEKFLASEIVKWARVVKHAGIKPQSH